MSGTGHWSEFIDNLTPDQVERIRYYMIKMRTPEGMQEVVDCMMCAVHMLSSEGGREMADRLAAAREQGAMSD